MPFSHRNPIYHDYQTIQAYQELKAGQSYVQLPPHLPDFYPDIEPIRKFHDLHSLAQKIGHARLVESLKAPFIDIVESETEHVFAKQVPKTMLFLFCGRAVIYRYLKDIKTDDDQKPSDGESRQALYMPPKTFGHAGFSLMLTWMMGACRKMKLHNMSTLSVPRNLFTAISLARALSTFGLYHDAFRVDKTISGYFYRKLWFFEVRSIWNGLSRDDKYTHRLVTELRERLDKVEKAGENDVLGGIDNIRKFIDREEDLASRIADPKVNDQYKPSWCGEWIGDVPTTAHDEGTEVPMPEPQAHGQENASNAYPHPDTRNDSAITMGSTLENHVRVTGYATCEDEVAQEKQSLSEVPKVKSAAVLRIVNSKRMDRGE